MSGFIYSVIFGVSFFFFTRWFIRRAVAVAQQMERENRERIRKERYDERRLKKVVKFWRRKRQGMLS